jgi:hypothetical protein
MREIVGSDLNQNFPSVNLTLHSIKGLPQYPLPFDSLSTGIKLVVFHPLKVSVWKFLILIQLSVGHLTLFEEFEVFLGEF